METTKPFVRSKDDRILTGVSGGLASVLGVNTWIVRLSFCLMVLGSGTGLLAYIAAFLISAAPSTQAEPAARPVTARHTAGVLCIAFGVLWIAHTSGAGLPSDVLWPLILLAGGSAIIWARLSDDDRARIARDPRSILLAGRRARWRLFVGGIVLAAGGLLFVANSRAVASTPPVLLAVVATVVGLLLLLGPWLIGFAQEASNERRARIRNEERAEMSAHLHDSVLNTLAMIQRSEAPPEVITLARRQERELRAWMQGRIADENVSLDAALDAMVTRVESQHNATIDVVIVGGSLAMDDPLTAFVSAIQEATVNACRHANVETVAVYVEIEPDELIAFVRDQGNGFDPQDVPTDRRGISDSIEGRMKRMGGNAIIRSTRGEGTEVELRLPRGDQ